MILIKDVMNVFDESLMKKWAKVLMTCFRTVKRSYKIKKTLFEYLKDILYQSKLVPPIFIDDFSRYFFRSFIKKRYLVQAISIFKDIHENGSDDYNILKKGLR